MARLLSIAALAAGTALLVGDGAAASTVRFSGWKAISLFACDAGFELRSESRQPDQRLPAELWVACVLRETQRPRCVDPRQRPQEVSIPLPDNAPPGSLRSPPPAQDKCVGPGKPADPVCTTGWTLYPVINGPDECVRFTERKPRAVPQ